MELTDVSLLKPISQVFWPNFQNRSQVFPVFSNFTAITWNSPATSDRNLHADLPTSVLGPCHSFPTQGPELAYKHKSDPVMSPCLKPINDSICTQNKLQPSSPHPLPADFGPCVPLQHQLTAPTLHHV